MTQSMHSSDLDKAFSNKLKELRAHNGVSQNEISKYLGVTFQQIQKYESGTNRITVGKGYMVAKYFNLPFEDFFKSAPDIDSLRNTKQNSVLARELLDAFAEIKDPDLKRKVIEMCRLLSRQE